MISGQIWAHLTCAISMKFRMEDQEIIIYRLVMRNTRHEAYFPFLIFRAIALLTGDRQIERVHHACPPRMPLIVWCLQTQPKKQKDDALGRYFSQL